MTQTLYYLAGLPRSGSTLLANLLMQNPEISVTGTSGLPRMLEVVQNNFWTLAPHQAMKPSESLQIQQNLLRGLIESYHQHLGTLIIINKSRAWPAHVELLTKLQEKVKIIVMVRSLPNILASFEKSWRSSKSTIPSAIPLEHSAGIEQRLQYLASQEGPIGSAFNALQDSLKRGNRSYFHFIEYMDLTTNPVLTMTNLYQFLEEPEFAHDFEKIEQVSYENDIIHGFLGLHDLLDTRVVPATDLTSWQSVLGNAGKPYLDPESHFWRELL